jgi:hypothetical protein
MTSNINELCDVANDAFGEVYTRTAEYSQVALSASGRMYEKDVVTFCTTVT